MLNAIHKRRQRETLSMTSAERIQQDAIHKFPYITKTNKPFADTRTLVYIESSKSMLKIDMCANMSIDKVNKQKLSSNMQREKEKQTKCQK